MFNKGIWITKDALRFLQAYMKEMIDVGGENLPKTISTKLGTKLGKLYKNKGISSIEKGLKEMYKVMKGKVKIIKINDKTYEITVKYSKNFCPVGGTHNRGIAKLFQKSICNPYTQGFLAALDPEFKYIGTIHGCIIDDNKKFCNWTLQLEEKEK